MNSVQGQAGDGDSGSKADSDEVSKINLLFLQVKIPCYSQFWEVRC